MVIANEFVDILQAYNRNCDDGSNYEDEHHKNTLFAVNQAVVIIDMIHFVIG